MLMLLIVHVNQLVTSGLLLCQTAMCGYVSQDEFDYGKVGHVEYSKIGELVRVQLLLLLPYRVDETRYDDHGVLDRLFRSLQRRLLAD